MYVFIFKEGERVGSKQTLSKKFFSDNVDFHGDI